MVNAIKTVKQILLYFLILSYCLVINSCNLDLFGFFYSTTLDERLRDRYTFNFLSESDRNISLGNDYSFILVADTHFEDGDTFGLSEEKLRKAIADNNAEFAVFLGDITQHGIAQDIDKFLNMAKGAGVPVYPVIGNHDVYFENYKNVWKNKIGSTCYKIEAGSAVLFILDSANSYFGKDQLDWLEKEIAGIKKKAFVFTHSPLFVPAHLHDGPFNLQQITDTNERARILYILRDKADVMFMGHLHTHYENTAGGVKYVGVESYVDDQSYLLVTVKGANVSYTTKKF